MGIDPKIADSPRDRRKTDRYIGFLVQEYIPSLTRPFERTRSVVVPFFFERS